MVFTIQEINYGIASRIGDKVFINKKLKEYNISLFNALLSHELEHTSKYSWKDLKIDLFNDQLKNKKKEYYKFILTHPSSWIEFSPIQFYQGQMIINPVMIGIYGFILFLFLGGIIWT